MQATTTRRERSAVVRARAVRELSLVVIAVLLAGGAYALATAGLTGKAPSNVGVFVGVIAVAYLFAHFVTVRFAPGADPAFLPAAAVLASLGYAMIYRIEWGLRQDVHRSLRLATPQFVWILIGLGVYCLTLVLVRDQRRLDAYTYTIGLLGIAMLLLPIAPHVGPFGGFSVNGARLWFQVGSLSFQPAEIGKVLIVIFLASYLNAKKELLSIATRRLGPFRLPEPRYLAPLLGAWGVSLAILFVENDLGSSLLFFGIFIVMLWVATARWEYVVLGAVLFAVGAALAYLTVPHVEVRVAIWLHALDPAYIQDRSYQLAQGLFAFGTGGIAGTGLGLGHPVLIPDVWTDFIMAAVGEELGLLGVTAVLLLYVVLVGRGLKASLDAKDGFSKLLATGLATVIALQTFVIVGGVTRLIPLTGVTLPFVSYGGSSVVTNFVLLALLVRVSAGPAPRRTSAGLPGPSAQTEDAQVDRQTRRLGLAFLVLFLLLFAQVNYLQVFAADTLANNPANHRLILSEYDVLRGAILARDGQTVLAESVPSPGPYKYLRRYPHGLLYGPVTGYYSLLYQRSGLEAAYNDYLSGRASALIPQNVVDEILGRPKRGANVITTLEPLLQRTAAQALGSLQGAVVAMDPRTGEVLAMVSTPSFDPNPLASHNTTVEQAAWRRIQANPGKPLVSKASQELYPPGSTFKLVTASADLQAGASPITTYPNPHQLDLPQTTNTLKNFGDEWCLNGAPQITLDQALTVSCNVTFGQIGLDLQGGPLVGQAQAYGFNRHVPFDLPFSEGSIPPASTFPANQPLLAYSAIGQASVLANPLQMALIASAVANGGVEMAPRLVTQIRDSSGRVVRSFGPTEVGRPISQVASAQLTAMMVNVVDHGTGTAAQIPGVQVAGKTGTAQHGGSGNPHAWFVAFAPAAHPTIAVAVIVLDGGNLGSEATGGRVAAPIARAVIEAALGRG